MCLQNRPHFCHSLLGKVILGMHFLLIFSYKNETGGRVQKLGNTVRTCTFYLFFPTKTKQGVGCGNWEILYVHFSILVHWQLDAFLQASSVFNFQFSVVVIRISCEYCATCYLPFVSLRHARTEFLF